MVYNEEFKGKKRFEHSEKLFKANLYTDIDVVDIRFRAKKCNY